MCIRDRASQAWLYVPTAILLGALHGLEPVSFTNLDVYKRQLQDFICSGTKGDGDMATRVRRADIVHRRLHRHMGGDYQLGGTCLLYTSRCV